jgi:hypothetical protein
MISETIQELQSFITTPFGKKVFCVSVISAIVYLRFLISIYNNQTKNDSSKKV